ncbi:MAG: BON domain-containing protein [Spirochaetota bacterium]
MARTDEQIKKDVVDQLYWDNQTDASGVQVMVNRGNVTLSGVVPTYAARKAAVNDAWMVPGVRSVLDQLLVRYTVEVPPDDQVERQVTGALIENPDIPSEDIRVTVNAGLVTMEGTVDVYWKKLLAEDLPATIPGVLNIRNTIAVVPTQAPGDEEIARQVVRTLDRSEPGLVEAVTVQVTGGVVTLTGMVPDRVTRLSAEEKAAHIAGVVEVENQLVVETG